MQTTTRVVHKMTITLTGDTLANEQRESRDDHVRSEVSRTTQQLRDRGFSDLRAELVRQPDGLVIYFIGKELN